MAKKIFVVCSMEVSCGCGMEVGIPIISFDNKPDAEDFCSQFNPANDKPVLEGDEFSFSKRRAFICEVWFTDNKVTYVLDVANSEPKTDKK